MLCAGKCSQNSCMFEVSNCVILVPTEQCMVGYEREHPGGTQQTAHINKGRK